MSRTLPWCQKTQRENDDKNFEKTKILSQSKYKKLYSV
jgi:hypothetical protein